MSEVAIQRVDPRVPVVKSLLERAAPSFAQVLPKHLTPDRLVRIAIASVAKTPALLECNQQSLLQAVMQAAELGLEPGSALGEAYLVPFKGKVTMVPGYRGLISLARRSGQIEDIEAHVVYARDKFTFRHGTSACLDHEPSLEADPGEIVCVYAMGWVKGSSRPHVEVMTKAQIDKVRDGSPGKNQDPWRLHYGEMARKTVVRRLVKYLPMSVELARAVELDDEQHSVGANIGADVIDIQEAPTRGLKAKAKAKAAELAQPAPTPVAEEPEADWMTGDPDPSVPRDRVPGEDD